MDFIIWILFLVLGAAAGSGVTAFFLRNRDRQETEQARNGYEAEINSLNSQLRDVKNKLESVRDEGKRYWDELQSEKKSRKDAEEKTSVIPGLEKKLQAKELEANELTQENNELKNTLAQVEKELDDERKSFKESLIFVQGSHYLPAEVVRNMMRLRKSTDRSTDE